MDEDPRSKVQNMRWDEKGRERETAIIHGVFVYASLFHFATQQRQQQQQRLYRVGIIRTPSPSRHVHTLGQVVMCSLPPGAAIYSVFILFYLPGSVTCTCTVRSAADASCSMTTPYVNRPSFHSAVTHTLYRHAPWPCIFEEIFSGIYSGQGAM